jgi:hypothetical protein
MQEQEDIDFLAEDADFLARFCRTEKGRNLFKQFCIRNE